MTPGTRVRPTPKYWARYAHTKRHREDGREGTVVGRPSSRSAAIRVKWDDIDCPVSLHRSFVEAVEE